VIAEKVNEFHNISKAAKPLARPQKQEQHGCSLAIYVVQSFLVLSCDLSQKILGLRVPDLRIESSSPVFPIAVACMLPCCAKIPG
jgi:hypothetical protein